MEGKTLVIEILKDISICAQKFPNAILTYFITEQPLFSM